VHQVDVLGRQPPRERRQSPPGHVDVPPVRCTLCPLRKPRGDAEAGVVGTRDRPFKTQARPFKGEYLPLPASQSSERCADVVLGLIAMYYGRTKIIKLQGMTSSRIGSRCHTSRTSPRLRGRSTWRGWLMAVALSSPGPTTPALPSPLRRMLQFTRLYSDGPTTVPPVSPLRPLTEPPRR
jgi:hypothetical protein